LALQREDALRLVLNDVEPPQLRCLGHHVLRGSPRLGAPTVDVILARPLD
jgi:hypothetical protein